MKKLFRRLWIGLTWRQVICAGCRGTGICASPNGGAMPSKPHSCCSCSNSRDVPLSWVSEDYRYGLSRDGTTVTVGNGLAWARPWSDTQYDVRPW